MPEGPTHGQPPLGRDGHDQEGLPGHQHVLQREPEVREENYIKKGGVVYVYVGKGHH